MGTRTWSSVSWALLAVVSWLAAGTARGDEGIESIRGGGLASGGVMAGVALVSQVFLDDRHYTPGVTAMPYVALMPFHFLVRGGESRAYCAAQIWSTEPPQEVADAMATRRAAARLGIQPSQVTPEQVLDQTGWQLGVRAACNQWARLGFYVGVPVPYTTSIAYDDVRAAREVVNYGGGGLVFSLPLYLTIHAGVSVATFADNADPADLQYAGMFTFGLGTSLDWLDFLLSL